MVLFSKITQIQKPNNTKRKEYDSFLENINMSKTSIITSNSNHGDTPSLYEKRAPLCTSSKKYIKTRNTMRKRASVTVEASLVVPLFFFGILCMLYLLEIMSVQMSIRSGLHCAMDSIIYETSTYLYMSDNEINEYIVEGIGESYLENSIIIGGSSGLDCTESSVSMLTGIVDLEVSYEVELPIPKFGFPTMCFTETLRAKGWTGYVKGVLQESDTIVYITDNASVYHVNQNCSHLDLTISSASYADVASLRNEYGGTYIACGLCIEGEVTNLDTIYIAESGAAYHSTLSCSGLKRTVYAVNLSEVIGKGVCSRCGQ